MNDVEKLDALNRGKILERIDGDFGIKFYRIVDNKLRYSKDFSGFYTNSGSYSNILDYEFRIVTEKKAIVIDGKTIEISEESYNELKRSLT